MGVLCRGDFVSTHNRLRGTVIGTVAISPVGLRGSGACRSPGGGNVDRRAIARERTNLLAGEGAAIGRKRELSLFRGGVTTGTLCTLQDAGMTTATHAFVTQIGGGAPGSPGPGKVTVADVVQGDGKC